MKKVWNVYKLGNGTKATVEEGSAADATWKNGVSSAVFLGQVTEEIEAPKKEVEKVVEKELDLQFSIYWANGLRVVSAIIPTNAYEPKLHYKIRE